ncbi:hypothetical protein GQ42DRAFT_163950 [Ramicandelaber brevisporus]|nr:hypothetical protein GQ42DRAFT_163950 [Ramicandelaber brevisporus]
MTPPHQHGSRPHGPHGSPPPHGHHGHHHPGAPMTPPHGSHGSHGSHSHHGHTHHAHHGHHHSGAPVTPPPKMAHIPYMRRVYPGNIMELNTERPKYKDHVPPKFITEQVRVMETFEGYSFRIEGISAQVFGSSELHHSPKQMQDVPQIVFDVYKAEHVRFAAWGVEHSPASIPGCDCEHCIKKVALMADLKLKRKVNVNGAHSHYDGKALIVFLPYL